MFPSVKEPQISEPSNWNLDDIKQAMPESVFEHCPSTSLLVLMRDISMAIFFTWLNTFVNWKLGFMGYNPYLTLTMRVCLWCAYWWFQGLVFTGIWVIGHECAHESFLPNKKACNIIGLLCHTFLWTPHFSWKFVHQIHHRYHGHMEKDQHWIPSTRSKTTLCSLTESRWEHLEDTPLFNLVQLIVQQIIGFPLYLLTHVTGPRDYPRFTSHFNPFSILFMDHQRMEVIVSNIALLLMGCGTYSAIATWGGKQVFLLYGIPYLIVNHWVTMIVYLHHTDPEVPHYQSSSWTYSRGALATIDRDFLGWQGRFFLHDIAHFHTIHHLFPRMPFYNCELATKHLKSLIGKDLNQRDDPVFKSLWSVYNSCNFVDKDDGDILFYRNAHGNLATH